MTKYIKTGATEFEQFDGSDEMIGKYDIDPEQIGEGMPMYQLETLKGTIQIFIGDWIATGVEGEHWAVKDEIFKKTYKKLPVIPKVYGDTIEEYKTNHYPLSEIFTEWDWHYDEQEMIARAWLDGYEVADD